MIEVADRQLGVLVSCAIVFAIFGVISMVFIVNAIGDIRDTLRQALLPKKSDDKKSDGLP